MIHIADWRIPSKMKRLNYFLDTYPLQFVTDDVHQNVDLLLLGSADDSRTAASLRLSLQSNTHGSIYIEDCMGRNEVANLDDLPLTNTKVWALIKTQLSLILECEGEKVYKLDIYSSFPRCVTRYGETKVKFISFTEEDNAAKVYRTKPGKRK